MRGEKQATKPALKAKKAEVERAVRAAEKQLGVTVRVEWTGRESNEKADSLANQAADEAKRVAREQARIEKARRLAATASGASRWAA